MNQALVWTDFFQKMRKNIFSCSEDRVSDEGDRHPEPEHRRQLHRPDPGLE